jgi:membrane-associated phospholipid phosphatase
MGIGLGFAIARVRWARMSLPGRREHPLLSNRRLDILTAVLLALATGLIFLLVGVDGTRGRVQSVDDWFLRVMVSNRAEPFTAVAKVFNFLGIAAVTVPVRLVVAGYLAWRRRWWHFSAFVLAMIVSEALIGPLKGLFERPRPPVSLALVATSGASFPSGHAVAASVTVVAIVLALFPAGPRRWAWGLSAALFSFVMAVSRAYLAAHWLSDAAAGTLLGTTVALSCALVVQWVRDERESRRATTPQQASVPSRQMP